MNEVEVFGFESRDVRVVTINNEAWFVGKDVAEVLCYSNPNEAISDHIDDDDKLNSKTLSSLSLDLGQRGGWLINESGLYSLILRSSMPEAKKFKKWITSEVLPSIRKNGGYLVGQEKMSDIDILTQAVLLANRLVAEKNKKIEIDAPKVEAFEMLMKSEDFISITNVAKHFTLPPKLVVFPFLRKYGYLTTRDLPTQKSIDEDLMYLRSVPLANGTLKEQAVVKYQQLDNWRKNVLPRMQNFDNE